MKKKYTFLVVAFLSALVTSAQSTGSAPSPNLLASAVVPGVETKLPENTLENPIIDLPGKKAPITETVPAGNYDPAVTPSTKYSAAEVVTPESENKEVKQGKEKKRKKGRGQRNQDPDEETGEIKEIAPAKPNQKPEKVDATDRTSGAGRVKSAARPQVGGPVKITPGAASSATRPVKVVKPAGASRPVKVVNPVRGAIKIK